MFPFKDNTPRILFPLVDVYAKYSGDMNKGLRSLGAELCAFKERDALI
jgi:hypothetical protein